MSQTKRPPPLDGADGPGERHRRDAFDGRKNSHTDHVPQARNKARFQLLVSKLHALGPYPLVRAGAPRRFIKACPGN